MPVYEEVSLPGGLPFARFYGSAEYLMWWLKGDALPPLVTTGPPAASLQLVSIPRPPGMTCVAVPGTQGILGPGTVVLVGDDRVDQGTRSGGRLTVGYQFGMSEPVCGVEVSYFQLGSRSVEFMESSAGSEILARPFFDVNLNRPNSQLVATPVPGPGVAACIQQLNGGIPVDLFAQAGSVAVELISRLWGVESNFRCDAYCTPWVRADMLAGFRYADLDEGLNILEAIQQLPPGTQAAFVSDRFATSNQFFGPQFGLVAEFGQGGWYLDVRGKVAVGDTRQVIDINGNQVLFPFGLAAGSPVNVQGGLLALETNIGRFSRDRWSVVHEVGVNLEYQFTPGLRAFVGYTFLYWSKVVRPGEQVDLRVDQALIPNFTPPPLRPLAPTGLRLPAVLFRESDFWAQGLNFGLEYRY
jgi:hypothetical protein